MCGRYSFVAKKTKITDALPSVDVPDDVRWRYSIAPTHKAYVITNERPDHLQLLEWGLVPHWSATGENHGKLINARCEGIDEKPSFRDAIRRRRCLVPADSFYEWRKEPGNKKIPYRILPSDGGLMFFAGIWEEWGLGEKKLATFAVLTCPANQEVAAIHDRMPVILPAGSLHDWLEEKQPFESVLKMLVPSDIRKLTMYRVSEKLNKSNCTDSEELHQEVPEPLTLF